MTDAKSQQTATPTMAAVAVVAVVAVQMTRYAIHKLFCLVCFLANTKYDLKLL
jgi:hypothetical protein